MDYLTPVNGNHKINWIHKFVGHVFNDSQLALIL